MALEIVWTRRASEGFDRIIEYLTAHFTEKEVSEFVRQSSDFFELLKVFPEILQGLSGYPNVHRGPINRFTMVTYRIKWSKNQIEIINIRSTREVNK